MVSQLVHAAESVPTTPVSGTGTHPVARRIAQRFQESLYIELRAIDCSYREGVLTLHGVVPTFYLKQVCTSLTEGIDDIQQVDNRVEVMDWRDRRGQCSA